MINKKEYSENKNSILKTFFASILKLNLAKALINSVFKIFNNNNLNKNNKISNSRNLRISGTNFVGFENNVIKYDSTTSAQLLKKITVLFVSLLLLSVFVFADGWVPSKSSHETIFTNLITSKTDGELVTVSDPNGLKVFSNTYLATAAGSKVGIGTTSPSSILELATIDQSTRQLSLSFYKANSASVVLRGQKSRGSIVGAHTIVQEGDALLNIQGSGSDSSKFVIGSRIRFEVDGSPGIDDMPGRIVFHTTPDESDTPEERMRIDSSGNVGIGTASPEHILQIGDSTSAVSMSLRGPDFNTLSTSLDFEDNAGTGSKWFRIYHDTSANTLNIRSAVVDPMLSFARESGNVGIGTNNPKEKLHILGNLRLSDWATIHFTDGNGRLSIYENADTNTYLKSEAAHRLTMHLDGFKFFTAPSGIAGDPITWTERMRIANNGNVGIGAASPSAKLDVDAGTGRGIIEIDGSTGGCLKIRDTDDAGWTYCTFLDGAITCSTTAC